MQQDLLMMLSARKGHFKLESGHHNNFWLDLDLLFLRPRAVHRFAVELANRLAKHKPDAVCGPLVGGALIAEMIATELDAILFR
jgi:orotate phosphoribosyltransferase